MRVYKAAVKGTNAMDSLIPWFVSGRLALLTTAVLLLGGCEEHYTGMGERSLQVEPECVCNCTGGGEDDAGPGVLNEDILGFTYRFTSLEATAPIAGDNAAALNDFFTDGIEANTLNVMLQVKAFTPDEALEMRASGATYREAEKDYLLEESGSRIVCSMEGASFESTELSSLAFGLADLSEPLPVVNLWIAGRFSPSGDTIDRGRLVGALRTEDTKRIKLSGLTLDGLLRLVQAVPELDLDNDGEADAYLFEGNYTAKKVDGPETDAGTDAGTDAEADAGADAGADAETDAGNDAETDAGDDASNDAGE